MGRIVRHSSFTTARRALIAAGLRPGHGWRARRARRRRYPATSCATRHWSSFKGATASAASTLPGRDPRCAAGGARAASATRRRLRAPDYVATRPRPRLTPARSSPTTPARPGVDGGWQQAQQWNFLPCGSPAGSRPPRTGMRPGRDRRDRRLAEPDRGRPPGRRRRHRRGRSTPASPTATSAPRFRRSPDFKPKQFVARLRLRRATTRLPLDENGHGTHVAGTIAEQTDNGMALTGLAYGAEADAGAGAQRRRAGTAHDVARGIRCAAKHGAQVINMSFEFCVSACKPSNQVQACEDVPGVCEAIDAAQAHGAVVIVVGRQRRRGAGRLPRGRHVDRRRGTTEGGCLADYSSRRGPRPRRPGRRRRRLRPGRPVHAVHRAAAIYQVTLSTPASTTATGASAIPAPTSATSMAAAHECDRRAGLGTARAPARPRSDPGGGRGEAQVDDPRQRDPRQRDAATAPA